MMFKWMWICWYIYKFHVKVVERSRTFLGKVIYFKQPSRTGRESERLRNVLLRHNRTIISITFKSFFIITTIAILENRDKECNIVYGSSDRSQNLLIDIFRFGFIITLPTRVEAYTGVNNMMTMTSNGQHSTKGPNKRWPNVLRCIRLRRNRNRYRNSEQQQVYHVRISTAFKQSLVRFPHNIQMG